MTSRLMKLKNDIQENWEGLVSVFGAFLLQLCAGSYHGTFGNLLPYITSYLRQVNMCKYNLSESIIMKILYACPSFHYSVSVLQEIMTNNVLHSG